MKSSDKISKEEMIRQLKLHHLNFEFGLASLSLINDPSSLKILPKLSVSFGSYQHSHDRVISLLKNDADKTIMMNNFLRRSLLCTTLKDSYDIVLYYCNNGPYNQYKKLFRQDFFQYVRMIRNAMSHGYRFYFSGIKPKYRDKIFPVQWNDKIITLSDEHKEITENELGIQDVFTLLDRLNEFILNTLD